MLNKSKRLVKICFKRGQSVLEYAILVALVSAAFLTMAVYLRRAIQGRLYKIDEQIAAKMKGPPASSIYVPPI